MLAFPKRLLGGKKTDLQKALQDHITRKYSNALAHEHSSQCAAVARARALITEEANAGSSNNPDEVVRDRLVQYYRLIRTVETRFEAISIQFMWRDAFQQVCARTKKTRTSAADS